MEGHAKNNIIGGVSLRFDNVTSAYKKKRKQYEFAFADLSFSVAKGSFCAILGPSGCGKTTLLRTLLGSKDYEGNIYYNDIDIEEIPIKDRGISYISQLGNLYSNMTVFDNLAFPLKNEGMDFEEIKSRVLGISNDFDLMFLLDRKPRYLSFGQQEKVMLAKALLSNSELFLFDEPFANLDDKSKLEAEKVLKDFSLSHQATYLYVTHSLKEASVLADTYIIMNDGRIEQIGSPLEVVSHPKNSFVRSFLEAGDE